jgi:hypothetical protein
MTNVVVARTFEVCDGDTKELLAGTFDPDLAAPACIV